MPVLYDPRGREIDLDALKQPPPLRAPIKPKSAFELDPERVVSLFKTADGGDPRELQHNAAEIERRDGLIGGNLRTRRRAVSRLTWTVETPADTSRDGGSAAEIVDAVKRDIVDALWFRRLCFDLLDATLKGFAVADVSWETGADVWRPRSVTWVDQRHTLIDPADGVTLRWRDPKDESRGIDIAPWTAVIHESGDVSGPLWSRGLMRVLTLLYSIKRLGVRSWASFVELYGVPRIHASIPTQWSPEQRDDFIMQLEAWAHAGYLVTQGAEIQPQTVGSQAASEAAHEGLAGWCDEQASIATLGQTMTSRDGSSRAQAEVHERVAEWILESDALELAGTLVRDLVEPYVRINFGEDAPVPVLVPQVQSSSWREFRLKVLQVLLPHGLRVEQSVARDLGGFPEPADGAAVLGVGAGPVGQTEQGGATLGARGRTASARGSRPARLAEDDRDFIDVDSEAASAGWRETMRPLIDATQAAASEAEGADDAARYDDFLRRLEARQVDGDAFVRSVAAWTMQARGVGDGTDEVT